MAKLPLSMKRLQISKANSSMVLTVAIAAFVVAFSLVASRALLNKRAYQARVIAAKEQAVDQLEANIKAANTLTKSYQAFIDTSENVIGGNPNGTGDRDGDNAKIILDALPSQYDFPALTSSLEKILTNNGYRIDSITGTDDELAQQEQQGSATPQPIEMPFTISVTTNLDGARNLLSLLERSIRPIKIQTIQVSGSNNDLQLTISAITYYQPQRDITVKTEAIR